MTCGYAVRGIITYIAPTSSPCNPPPDPLCLLLAHVQRRITLRPKHNWYSMCLLCANFHPFIPRRLWQCLSTSKVCRKFLMVPGDHQRLQGQSNVGANIIVCFRCESQRKFPCTPPELASTRRCPGSMSPTTQERSNHLKMSTWHVPRYGVDSQGTVLRWPITIYIYIYKEPHDGQMSMCSSASVAVL